MTEHKRNQLRQHVFNLGNVTTVAV